MESFLKVLGPWRDSILKRPYFLAWVALFCNAIVACIDSYVVTNVIVSPAGTDPLIGALAYLLVGGMIGFIVMLLLVLSFGRFFDPSFTGLIPSSRSQLTDMVKLSSFNGFFSAMATFSGLAAYIYASADSVTFLSSLVVIYVLMWEWNRGKLLRPWAMLFPVGLTIVGIGVIYGPKLELFVALMAWVLLARNIPYVISDVQEQYVVRERGHNALAFNVWRFFFLMLCGSIFSVIAATVTGNSEVFVNLVTSNFVTAGTYIVPLMVAVTFANNAASLAKQVKGISVTSLNIIAALKVLLVFLITFMIDSRSKGVLGPFDASPEAVQASLIGGGLIFVAIAFVSVMGRKDQDATSASTATSAAD